MLRDKSTVPFCLRKYENHITVVQEFIYCYIMGLSLKLKGHDNIEMNQILTQLGPTRIVAPLKFLEYAKDNAYSETTFSPTGKN